jgi:probable rRNA maturation factor
VINIAFLEDDEIRVLNNQYREKDQSTDVLSFHYLDDFSLAQEDEVVGEIILSESHILRQASDHQHSAEKEFLILVLH